MISVHVDGYRFHVRAAAVVVDDGHLLLHRLDGDAHWALPGGRVNAGEHAADAVVRELVEELGVEVHCGRLLGTGENFFEHAGEPHHEIGLYFEATLPPTSALLDKRRVHVGDEGGRRLEFRWWPLRGLAGIDMRPACIRDALAADALPPHVVQDDLNARARRAPA